jgi:hypothetical protein
MDPIGNSGKPVCNPGFFAPEPGNEPVPPQGHQCKDRTHVIDKIKDSLDDGKNYDSLAGDIGNVGKRIQGMRMASKEFEEAQSLALEVSDRGLVKDASTKAVGERIKIAQQEAENGDRNTAISDLRKAVELAEKSSEKELVEQAWGAIAELENPKPKPPVYRGGC